MLDLAKVIIEFFLNSLPSLVIVGLVVWLVGLALIVLAILGKVETKILTAALSGRLSRLALALVGGIPMLVGLFLVLSPALTPLFGRGLETTFAPHLPLTVTDHYSFEPGQENPWQARGEKVSIARSSSFAHSGGHSLEVKLDVGPYEPGAHCGIGVSPTPFGVAKAIVAYLYLPTSAQTEDHQFVALFRAIGNDGREQFSHDMFLRPGAWVPLFWGTEYGYWDASACTDADQDGSCDDRGGYWRDWDGSLSALEIVMASIDRAIEPTWDPSM